MISFKIVGDAGFESLIRTFDERIDYLKNQFNIELKSYGNILRIAFNIIQSESFDILNERLNINRELETALSNHGGFTTDFLGEQNSKTTLTEIINCLKNKPLKLPQLILHLNSDNQSKTIIADINDIDFLKQLIPNGKVNFVSLRELKARQISDKKLVFYSFNGKKDFDFIYNLQSDVTLVLYEQEHQLFQKQLQDRKRLIEEEVKSTDRFKICDISYEPVPDLPFHISQTIESIVNRIDEYSNKAYEGYREESDLLLAELDERIIFKVTFPNSESYVEGNDTVFNEKGNLVKVHKLNKGDQIRIYPSEQFGEKLYQVAVETDKDVFGKVEEHSKQWLSALIGLREMYKHSLYSRLKANGMRVLPATVEGYFNGYRKFPMFNNDLKVIFKLRYPEKNDVEIDLLLAPIRKSKATYNSTMIALGRGMKQEIKLYLKEKRIGEIIAKLQFNTTTLQTFIDEHMPLRTITGKEIIKDESRQLELFNTTQQVEV